MGNAIGCIFSAEKTVKKKKPKKRTSPSPSSSHPHLSSPNSLLTTSNSTAKKDGFIFPSLSSSSSSSNKDNSKVDDLKGGGGRGDEDDELLKEQAIAAALLFRQHQRNGTLPFPRSTSVAYHSDQHRGSNKKQSFPRSSSSRQRSLADPLLKPVQLVNQDFKTEDLETKHFILVHGGGFGAWCWYKIMTLLEEIGLKVDAVDLTGSGTHSSDTNTITTLSQYIKPLTDIFQKLKEEEKVILVGHDIGGACISHVMELFPSKIAKSVFISATMLSNGQSALDILSQQTDSTDLIRQAQVFLHANGKENPPTAIDLGKAFLKDLLFNRSSAKDIALASVSMRPIPFAPVLEKLSLSDKNYGSIRRFYIKTQEDFAIPVSLQDSMIKSNPPEQVFQLKGSDHAPFFSKPQALHRILMEILQIPPKQS